VQPNIDKKKSWREWTQSETEDIIRAFEARASISYSSSEGTPEERWNAGKLHAEVQDRCVHPIFARKIDPFFVVVAFGGGSLGGAVPGDWPAVLAASPVVATPVNASDFVYSFFTRESAAVFLGYISQKGFHGWVITSSNVVYY